MNYFKNYAQAVIEMEGTAKSLQTLYMCSEVPENCNRLTCYHSYPHRPYQITSKNQYPQCNDNGTYCHIKEKLVNCKPITKEGLNL